MASTVESDSKIEQASRKLGKPDGEGFVELMEKARPDRKEYQVTKVESATRASGTVQRVTVEYGLGPGESEELILSRYNASTHLPPGDIRAAIEKGIKKGRAAIDEIVNAVKEEAPSEGKGKPTLKEKYEAVRDEIYLQFKEGKADPFLAHTIEPLQSWYFVLERNVPIGLHRVQGEISDKKISGNFADYENIMFTLINCMHQHINNALIKDDIGPVYDRTHWTPLGVLTNYRLDKLRPKLQLQD